ncbi:MAG: hypothetical protein AMS21_01250 [Gemmatimonas sp. SG8_38_2]|nr:MAG: hypothetical protein AMS21_01250 [Gemmatimonas sp. SG8_38_2]
MSLSLATSIGAFLLLLGSAILVAWIAFLIGRRLGAREARREHAEQEGPVSSVVAATLAMLAFTLAITFNLAHEKYNDRKHLVREDVKSIRSAYDRALLLPSEATEKAHALLAEYAQIRAFDTFKEPDLPLEQVIRRSEVIQRKLWLQAVEYRGDPQIRFYLDALSTLANVHAERITMGAHDGVPLAVWICLAVVTALGMLAMGYQFGLAGSRRIWAMIPLVIAFCIVLCLAVDLDRPQQGILRVDQGPMMRLAEELAVLRG